MGMELVAALARPAHQQLGSRSALRQAVARQCDSERAAALLSNATASQRASQSFGNATASQRASRCTDSASAARQSPLATKQRQPPQWEWSWLLPSLGDSERAPPQWEWSWLLPSLGDSEPAAALTQRASEPASAARNEAEAAAAVGMELVAALAWRQRASCRTDFM